MSPDPNALDLALQRAVGDPAHRPAFYEALLHATVFVLGHTDHDDGRHTLRAGERVAIQSWERDDGTAILPFFSSLDRLEAAIQAPEGYVSLPARSLLEITRGAALVLNPGADHGKEFLPHEIEALLTTGVPQPAARRVVQEETRVLVGQPSAPPEAMLDALRRYLSTQPDVRAAYLAMMHDPSVDDRPHLLVGIAMDGDDDAVMRGAGTVATDTVGDAGPVDFIRVESGAEGLSAYMLASVPPFYERASRDGL